jgi:hypothetical protein
VVANGAPLRARFLQRPEARVLDLVLRHRRHDARSAAARQAKSGARIAGRRLSRMPCCSGPRKKSVGAPLRWVEADALSLPFPDAQASIWLRPPSAFGTWLNYDAGLREIDRVFCDPGGECGILDFGEPRGWLGRFYRFYFNASATAKVGTSDLRRARALRLLCRRRSSAFREPKRRCWSGCGASGIRRGRLDSLYLWDRGAVLGSEVVCRGRKIHADLMPSPRPVSSMRLHSVCRRAVVKFCIHLR